MIDAALEKNMRQMDTFMAWMNDAYGMEESLIKVLEQQYKRSEALPEAHAKIGEHLEKTREHKDAVEACIRRMGGDVSTTKDVMGKLSGMVNGMTMGIFSDSSVKDIHASYAAEHFEIATYTVLIAAAEELGQTETAEVCRNILADEEEMAEWLLGQIPTVVSLHIGGKV